MQNINQTSVRLAIIALTYLVLAAPALTPVLDADIWLHLKTGQWILQHRAVPAEDPFSTFGAGRTWIAYSWLFEVFVYVIYTIFGLSGLLVFDVAMSLCIALAVHSLIRRFAPPLAAETVLLAFVFVTLIPLVLTPRPWLFSMLFFSTELVIIAHARRSGRFHALWLLPPMFALWANLHIQFVYGLAAVALLMVEIFWKALTGSRSDRDSIAPVALIGLACLLAVSLNPYHMKVLWPVLDYAQHTTAFQAVSELQPMSFRSVPERAVLALTLAAVYALGSQRRWSPFQIMLLLLGVFLGFRAKRDIWVLALACAMVLSERLGPAITADNFTFKKWHLLIVGPLVAASLYLLAQHRQISERSLQNAVAKNFPVAAVRFIKANAYPGPLFNHFNWGGFLIWSLPELPVSMDGRTNLHGDQRLARSIATWSGRAGWDFDPELQASRLVITSNQWALTSLLRLDRRFRLVYEDSIASIFVRRAPMQQD
ncbi:MAG: hypothetical protein ACREQ7_20295 [Candidatus Binatia bacterium]